MASPTTGAQGPPCAFRLRSFLFIKRFEIFLFGFVCEIVIVFVLNGFVVIWDRLVVKWGVLSVPLGLWGLRAI